MNLWAHDSNNWIPIFVIEPLLAAVFLKLHSNEQVLVLYSMSAESSSLSEPSHEL